MKKKFERDEMPRHNYDNEIEDNEVQKSYAYLQPKDESKEVKEGGEEFKWDEELNNIVDSDGYTVASLSNKKNVPFKNYMANGPLLAQSKNMYYVLKKILKDFEQWPCLPSTERMVKEVLQKANPKK